MKYPTSGLLDAQSPSLGLRLKDCVKKVYWLYMLANMHLVNKSTVAQTIGCWNPE